MDGTQISVNDLLAKIGAQAIIIDQRDAQVAALQAKVGELEAAATHASAAEPEAPATV